MSAIAKLEVGSYEAKSRLPELLGLVEQGHTITITRHKRSIAKLIPIHESVADVVAALRELRDRLPAGRENNRELIGAGRRI